MISVISLHGTTDGSGDAVVDTYQAVTGKVLKVEVEGIALTDSANLTLAPVLPLAAGTTTIGDLIVNHADVGNATTNELYPRKAVQDNAGTTVNYAATFPIYEPYVVAGHKLRATISAGGATKAFLIRVVVEE